MPDEEKKDGVDRTSLDYRAGYCEGLRAFGSVLQLHGQRAKKGEVAGMTVASRLAGEMYMKMLATMRGGQPEAK